VVASTGSTTITRVAVGSRPCAEIGDYGALRVWADNDVDGSVVMIDPRSNRVVRRICVGGAPTGPAGAFGVALARFERAGRVWIPNKLDGTVTRIDPATNSVAETAHVGATPFVTNAAFGDVWVPDAAGSSLSRLRTG
jgi:DNA-binding beta-propeller fold protein YncE